MEIIFEIIFSLIFEGSIEGMKSKKVPIWVRVLCAAIVSLLFLIIVGIIGFIAVQLMKDNQYIPSILFIIVDLVLIIFALKKFKKLKSKD